MQTGIPANPPPLRFRRELVRPVDPPVWPTGYSCRTLLQHDVPAIHDILRFINMHGLELPDRATWWARLSGDGEFDPELCFVVEDESGRIAGVAQSWISAFLKDLAVHPDFRGRGIGENLLRQVFSVFRQRGASQLDLKVEAGNARAIRLYERAGMRRVPLAG